MTLLELKDYINGVPDEQLDNEVVIDLYGVGYVSGVCASISSISNGFDWYHGKVMIHPSKQLRFNDEKCKKLRYVS